MDKGYLSLPVQVSSRVDAGRLLRELQGLDDFLAQSAIREPGTPVKLPKTSRLLDDFIESNKLNPLHQSDRQRMLQFMTTVRSNAPVLHVSFAVDPSAMFVKKLTTWLRNELHPLMLLHIGLQPNIGAGCIVRTTNKHFDFSLRQHFKDQRQLLVESIHGPDQKTDKVVEVPEVVT